MAIRKSYELALTIGDPNDKGGNPIAADVYMLGAGSPDVVERHQIQLTATGWTGSLSVVARKKGSSSPFVAIPYTGRNVNGVVGTDASGSTALTTNSLIVVEPNGFEYGLLVNSWSAGTMLVEISPVRYA